MSEREIVVDKDEALREATEQAELAEQELARLKGNAASHEDPDDPDCGNLYRNLKFPDTIYDHISQYQEQKASAE